MRILLRSLLIGLLLSVPTGVYAQAVIEGRVTDATTGEPIPGTQVLIDALTLGTITDVEGNFMIPGVPAGTHTVEARFVGYEIVQEELTVADGETYTLDFSLDESALELDELVVTGTAGQARRREIGNSVAQIDLSKVEEPVQNMDQLFSGRVAGMNLIQASGQAGSGATIRLRGNNSVAMSNAPLIYIDGVRVRSDAYPKNVPPDGFQGRSNNDLISPLNDINPEDIERVEIIKGASATTLYGTEAAAGVIQIFTKKGRVGQPEWTFQVDQGIDKMIEFGTDRLPNFGMEPFLDLGHRQKYTLSTSGGGQDLRYFISGGYVDNDGAIVGSEEQRLNLRGNFGFSPIANMQVNITSAFAQTDVQNPPLGNNARGISLNAYRGRANYFGTERFLEDGSLNPIFVEQIMSLLDYEITSAATRYVLGGEVLYEPIPKFSHRFNVGLDRADMDNRNYRPFGFVGDPQGILSDQNWVGSTLTLEYVASYDLTLSEAFRTNLSVGGQKVDTEIRSVTAKGEGLPPGNATVSGASDVLQVREERQKVVNAGFFGQALFDFRNKYFLTIGGRVDGNSAFGENFGLQFYPKISASYVVSDEAFWPQALGRIKVRGAWGQAGRAPGAFDAVRTWDPVGWGGEVAFEPENVGNPELGPERTTEVELGLEAAILNDRVSLDFSWYDATTTDALFEVRQMPSMGFLNSQLENVGEISNTGVELAVNASIINQANFGLDLGFTLATNHSEIVSMGGAAGFALAGSGRVEEGFPVPVTTGARILNPDEFADPVYEIDPETGNADSRYAFGPNLPTHTIGGNVSFRLPYNVTLFARGEFMGGHYIADGASNNLASRGAYPLCDELVIGGRNAYELIEAGDVGQLTAYQRAMCSTSLQGVGNMFVYPADFFKLRELTLSVPIPLNVPGVKSARFTASGRNLFRWLNDDFLVFDPEMSGRRGDVEDDAVSLDQSRYIEENVPAPKTWTFSLRFVFQ